MKIIKNVWICLLISMFIFGFSITLSAQTVLTVANETGFDTFDPTQTSSSTDRHAFFNIYNHLFGCSLDGDIVPELVEDWEVTDEGKRLVMYIREGVKFHDGSKLDAEVVKWNLDRTRNPESSMRFGELREVKEVNVLDEFTVELVLENVVPILEILTDYHGAIVSRKAVEEHGDDYLQLNPVGTGSFQFVEWVRDDYLILDKFDEYWEEGLPKVDRLIFRPMPDAGTRMAELTTGNVDIVESIPERDVSRIATIPNVNANILKSYGMSFIALHNDDPIFQDKRLRQAITHGIQKDRIIEIVYLNLTDALASPLPIGTWAYDPDYKGLEYDPDKVAQLLEEAGKPDGFTFELVIPPWPDAVNSALLMQGDLAQFGIRVNIQQLEFGLVLDKLVQEDYQALWMDNPGRLDPGYIINRLLTTEGAANYMSYSNPEVDELVKEARSTQTMDMVRAAQLYQLAAQKVAEDAPWIFVAAYTYIYGYTDRVSNFNLYPHGRLMLKEVELN